MIDFTDQIAELLETEGFDGVTLKRLDQMTGSEGIVVQHLPEQVAESYYDGRIVCDLTARITVRMRSEEDAMQTCYAVAEELENRVIDSANGSYLPEDEYGLQITSRPQELAVTEQNFYAWRCEVGCRATVR